MSSQQTRFKAVVVIGSTASGKSLLAHRLFQFLKEHGRKTVCVNLDAFQLYRGVTAGTAKPTEEEIQEYCYRGIDLFEPHENVDARQYAEVLTRECELATARGEVPICVGGSGLYLRAFLHGLDELPARSEPVRSFLRACAQAWGWPHLHGWLSVLDAQRAAELHPNDKTRIERALEVFFVTGKKMSTLSTLRETLSKQQCLFDAFIVRVKLEETVLRERIEARTKLLLEAGWIEEVEALYQRYGDKLKDFQSMKAIGYPEILALVAAREKPNAEVLAQSISTATWQYARRQRTWNAKEVVHADFNPRQDSFDGLASQVQAFLLQ